MYISIRIPYISRFELSLATHQSIWLPSEKKTSPPKNQPHKNTTTKPTVETEDGEFQFWGTNPPKQPKRWPNPLSKRQIFGTEALVGPCEGGVASPFRGVFPPFSQSSLFLRKGKRRHPKISGKNLGWWCFFFIPFGQIDDVFLADVRLVDVEKTICSSSSRKIVFVGNNFALKKNKMGFLNQQITKKDAGSFFPEFMYRRELFALYTLR